jgi:tetratricopeptide (TPR) repeat protein
VAVLRRILVAILHHFAIARGTAGGTTVRIAENGTMRHVRADLDTGTTASVLRTPYFVRAVLAFVLACPFAAPAPAFALPNSTSTAGTASRRTDCPVACQLSSLERPLFADAAEGRLEKNSLWDAALVASGVETAEELGTYQERLAGLVDELRRSGTVRGEPRQKTEAIFEFMHRRVLRAGYRLECTDLRQVIDKGRFNCVSASVLFNCLAGEFGLKTCGLELPGHALSRVSLPDGPLDVETTCPRWFRLTSEPKPSADRRRAREISVAELIAMIYYNRGVDLLGEKRFAEAAAANTKALRLDPSNATARGNLLATLNNWAIELGTTKRYGEAAQLLRQGLLYEPTYETFSMNYVHLCRRWVEHLCEAGRFEEALAVLARAAASQPDCKYFREAQAEVYRRWKRSG